ncbi:hypothetical protein WJX73_000858 [Symbiochloris irregularis]|uniref:Uncharacterized protein n=1 Tax=Symbiochloris irregularis TaxID=706552 RepID=A0AAW1NRC4_9CHLO
MQAPSRCCLSSQSDQSGQRPKHGLAQRPPVGTSASEEASVVDLEDVGLVLDRQKFRKRGFYVTDFSASEWCQQQCAFSMSARLPKEVVTTPEMQAGLAVHAKLQAEVIQVVDIAVATPEDAWGLKLLNTIQGLHQLLSEGMTRELYIFGILQGHASKLLVRGVIDQLQLNDSGGLTVGLLQEPHAAFIAERGLSPTKQLPEEIQAHAQSQLGIAVGTLCEAVEQLSYAVAALPACNKAEVHYIWQQDGRSPWGQSSRLS